MHICVSKLTIIGSDNGLSPGRRQAIIWTNDGIFLIGPLGENFSEILIEIQTFSFKKMQCKVSCAKWRPFCLGLNWLRCGGWYSISWYSITWYWIQHPMTEAEHKSWFVFGHIHKSLVQKTTYNLPWWLNYGVSVVRILEKIDCIITSSHCIFCASLRCYCWWHSLQCFNSLRPSDAYMRQ